MIDHHVLAGISLCGVLLDLMGGLYLAYDLLGGKRGPLRTLTRATTYALLFGLGYGAPLGLTYGLIAGPGLGLALGLEYWFAGAASKAGMRGALRRTAFAFALFRGLVQGVAAGLTFDARFGVAFGLFSGIGLVSAYAIGFSPSEEYEPGAKPRFGRRKLVGTCARGLAIGLAGILAGALMHTGPRGAVFGLEIGLVVAAVGAIVATVSPYIEWWADNLPGQRLGLFGAMLVLLGFALQSLQYWAVLFDVQVR